MHLAPISRRQLLSTATWGLGSVALAWLLKEENLLAAEFEQPPLVPPTYDLHPKQPHHPPKAQAMISLFMQGGPSHMDLFDPKPELTRLDGQSSQATSSTTTSPRPAPRSWAARGNSPPAASAAPSCRSCCPTWRK
jgi:hypothetical protein